MAADRYSAAPSKRPATVADYIAAAPKETRRKLREMRACIRAAAPGATENLKWGMPAYSYRRILVLFAAFQHHIGFYAIPTTVKAFAKPLARYKTGRGSVQFPLDQPLPLTLIRKLTLHRVKEDRTRDAKWKE